MGHLKEIAKSKNKFGALVQYYNRVNMWANLPGKLILLALFYDRYGLEWWAYIVAFLFLVWTVFDFIFIYPQQADFGFRRSQSMREIHRDIKWIRKALSARTPTEENK